MSVRFHGENSHSVAEMDGGLAHRGTAQSHHPAGGVALPLRSRRHHSCRSIRALAHDNVPNRQSLPWPFALVLMFQSPLFVWMMLIQTVRSLRSVQLFGSALRHGSPLSSCTPNLVGTIRRQTGNSPLPYRPDPFHHCRQTRNVGVCTHRHFHCISQNDTCRSNSIVLLACTSRSRPASGCRYHRHLNRLRCIWSIQQSLVFPHPFPSNRFRPRHRRPWLAN